MAVADLTLEGLVHDLNNVFQTIGESAELLEEDPKWQKLAHSLQRSVNRGQRIVHSILDTNRSTTDLAPVLENAIQFCRDYLECGNTLPLLKAPDSSAHFKRSRRGGWKIYSC